MEEMGRTETFGRRTLLVEGVKNKLLLPAAASLVATGLREN